MRNPSYTQLRQLLSTHTRRLYCFDDDADGLMAFLLLQELYPATDYICLVTAPNDESLYFKQLREGDYDLTVILDRPLVSQKVIDAFERVLWIDHHPPVPRQQVTYYNPRLDRGNIPTAQLALELHTDPTPEQLLRAAAGSLWDYHIPDYMSTLRQQFPALCDIDSEDPDEMHFNSQFGYLLRIISFLLVGRKSTVLRNIRLIMELNSIADILTDEQLQQHWQQKENAYESLLSHAQENATWLSDRLLLYTYTSQESYTTYLSNHLRYLFQATVVVAKASPHTTHFTMSFRATDDVDLHKVLPDAFADLQGNFGGHEQACGGHIAQKDFETLMNRLRDTIP